MRGFHAPYISVSTGEESAFLLEIKILSINENQFNFFLFTRKMSCTKHRNGGLHRKSEQFSFLSWNPLAA